MKIVFEREKCIGCGTCVALCSDLWEMREDGKSYLKGSKKNPETNNYELEIEKPGCAKEAAESCPAQIIHLTQ